jgi:hypothetical protein
MDRREIWKHATVVKIEIIIVRFAKTWLGGISNSSHSRSLENWNFYLFATHGMLRANLLGNKFFVTF